MDEKVLRELGLTEEQAGRAAALLNKEEERLRLALKEQAVLLALAAAGARNPRVVKAAIDLEQVELTEDGELQGLQEQVEALKRSDGYLFETVQPAGFGGVIRCDSGVRHGGMGAMGFSELSDAEYYATVLSRR